jgi:hypothetical protein
MPAGLPPLRWRDLLPGVASFFAQPIALIALVGLAAFTFGRCSGHTDAKVQQWTDARDLQVGPLWKAFTQEQSADSATAARLLAWAQTEQRRADRLTDSLAAALKRVPTRAPVVPPPAYRADTATARAYQAGYTAGFATGWSEAADSGAASLRTQRAAYHTVQDSLMHATAKLETARRAGVVFAEHGDSLLKVAPIRKPVSRTKWFLVGAGAALVGHALLH